MATQIIPLEPAPEQTFRVVLDDVPYSCRVYWSDFDETVREIVGEGIEGCWYADIKGGEIDIKGMALVTGCDLLGAFAYDKIGQLWLADVGAKPSNPSYESFGVNHKLYYIPLADVESFNEATGQ